MKIGIIGVGNMGGAIAHALIERGFELYLSSKSSSLEEYRGENVHIVSAKELTQKSDYIILAVKPHIYPLVVEEIGEDLREETIVISIAAGQTIESLTNLLGDRKFILSMPNTPAMVGEGMSAICPSEKVTEEELSDVKEIFSFFGRVSVLDSDLFHGFSAACGSLPAYVYMFIESVADAAVLTGLKREDAYKFVAQTVLGSAKMVLETKKHPGELKDMVTSPRGTTIEGVRALEERGFRGTIIDAILAAENKSKAMRKE